MADNNNIVNRNACIVLFPEWIEAIKDLSDKQRLEVYESIIAYNMGGYTESEDPVVRGFMVLLKSRIDHIGEKTKANRENGKKGGRPSKSETEEEPNDNPNVTQPEPKENPTETQLKPNHNPEQTQLKPNDNPNVTQPEPNKTPITITITNTNTEREKEKEKEKAETASPVGSPHSRVGKKAPLKNTYGEFGNVKLSQEEHAKLIERYGEQSAREKIEGMSLYLASHGDKYKSHYATLLNWERMGGNRDSPKQQQRQKNVFDMDEQAKVAQRVYEQYEREHREGDVPVYDEQRVCELEEQYGY